MAIWDLGPCERLGQSFHYDRDKFDGFKRVEVQDDMLPEMDSCHRELILILTRNMACPHLTIAIAASEFFSRVGLPVRRWFC